MSKLAGVIQNLIIKFLLSNKDQIVAGINKKIDLPWASEKDEKELIEGIWEVIEEGVKEGIKGGFRK